MPEIQSYIAGEWCRGGGAELVVINPSTEEVIGKGFGVDKAQLDRALSAAAAGFRTWREVSPYERGKIMRRAVDIIRSRRDEIARIMAMEQGKPVAEAAGEVSTSADNIEWMAEEATRGYGRVLAEKVKGVIQSVRREPIGPVASFSPWNFPALTPARKIAGALAAGCSLILKPAEETPFTAIELVRAFVDAGLPANILNLVYGDPRQISTHLIGSPLIRKISFTGSTVVGKQLLHLAADGVKRATMELGGHAPVVVFDDVDVEKAAQQAVTSKFRNAGQVCTSPTRFYVQAKIYDRFVVAFAAAAQTIKCGDSLDPSTQMGPLANIRRLNAIESLVADTRTSGARLQCGGARIGNKGYFFQPTVFSDVPDTARIMSEEPFGPIAPIAPFHDIAEVQQKVNALPYGLAAYVMTRSLSRSAAMSEAVEAGMVCVNYFTVSTPASPFGGVKESGYGSEGGIEGLDAYLVTKSVTQRVAGSDLEPAA